MTQLYLGFTEYGTYGPDTRQYWNTENFFWTGWNDRLVEGSFLDSNGNSLPSNGPERGEMWKNNGEPNDATHPQNVRLTQSEDCVILEHSHLSDVKAGFADVDCTRNHKFLCQKGTEYDLLGLRHLIYILYRQGVFLCLYIFHSSFLSNQRVDFPQTW